MRRRLRSFSSSVFSIASSAAIKPAESSALAASSVVDAAAPSSSIWRFNVTIDCRAMTRSEYLPRAIDGSACSSAHVVVTSSVCPPGDLSSDRQREPAPQPLLMCASTVDLKFLTSRSPRAISEQIEQHVTLRSQLNNGVANLSVRNCIIRDPAPFSNPGRTDLAQRENAVGSRTRLSARQFRLRSQSVYSNGGQA